MATVKTLQIWFDAKTAQHCRPPAEPYYGGGVGPEMENGIIAQMVLRKKVDQQADYLGVFSWRTEIASGVRMAALKREAAGDSFDYVYPHFPNDYSNVWACSERKLPGITDAGKIILTAAGWGDVVGDLSRLPTPGVYGNWFYARSKLYRAYVQTMLLPCMEAIRGNPDAWAAARRVVEWKNDAIGPERVQSMFGTPYYVMHPFVLSRLFPTYAAVLGLKGRRVDRANDGTTLLSDNVQHVESGQRD